MEETKAMEYPQIRYHISYDEKLALKDLEDLINLIRISNNDTFQEMGISRARGNDLQRIEKIEPGSIEIVMAIIDVVSNIISVGHFIEAAKEIITNKIRSRREKSFKKARDDRKVYEKHDVAVNLKETKNFHAENTTTYILHIHIYNACDTN